MRGETESIGELTAFLESAGKAIMHGPCACGKTGEGKECNACREAQEEQRRQRAVAARIERIDGTIPAIFRELALGSDKLKARVKNEVARAIATQFVARRWVVLRGGSGAGKTSLAAAMLREWARTRHEGEGKFILAPHLGVARLAHEGKGEPDIVKEAIAARLVVLDDLGQERDTKLNAIPDVLFERHAHGRATWITTGVDEEQARVRYGDGIARRIFERADVIDVGGAT